MADFSYEDFIGWGDPNAGDPWNSPMPADTPGWEDFIGWGGDETQQGWYQGGDVDTSGDGGGGFWNTVLGGLGSIGSFLGKNAGLIGPAVSALGSLGGGAIGSNAANEAARLQSAALNRGIDLQTAQWLQQQANQAPWMQAGQGALGELTWRQAQEQSPTLPEATPAVSGANYALPAATPGWSPQTYGGYTPGAVPQASQYGYQGPQVPGAGDYRWTPGQGPQAANYRYTPGAVPTLSGKDLLANDPGYQFRMDESRKALEGSAAARGDLLSGQNLKALQSRSQDLASQEYGQAWNRASQQAQMREQWNQTAQQMGFSQAQTEAAWREQMAQASSQQGFAQALQGQGQQWQQGLAGQQFDWTRALQEAQQREQGQQFGFGANLQAQQLGQRERQQYETDLYNRMMGQSTLRYGQDVNQDQINYQRQQQAYQNQIAEMTRQFNQAASIAGIGQTAVGNLGITGQNNATQMASLLSQLGTAQGQGAAGSGLMWNRALTGATNQLPSLLSSLNA